MSIKLQLPTMTELKPRITVVGVGGAGGNAINNMIATGLEGVDFVAANTDAQALAASSAEHRIQLGATLTEGLGAGSKPEIGEAAAEEAIDEIRATLSGSHMVFIAAGMGGGTGTGAAAVVARVAKELGILTVGVVTKPFNFEGSRRMRMAEAGINELHEHVDTLIVIPNQNLFRIANEKTSFADAFLLADQVLHSGIACVTDLIVRDGLINLDFADVRTVLSGMGPAMMGTGEAGGETRAVDAAELAILNPLLDDVSLHGAKGLLISISGNRGLTLYEVDEAANRVREEVDPEANIIVGATFDDSLGDKVRVSIVASGLVGSAYANDLPAHDMTRDGWAPRSRGQSGRPLEERLSQALDADDDGEHRESRHGTWHDEPQAGRRAGRHRPLNEPPTGPGERAGTLWQGPGDVVIELGPPQLGGTGSPNEQRSGDRDDAVGRRGFAPQPPQSINRGPRRMPDISEFPLHAQQEYQAKRSSAPAAQASAHVEKKRPGLFARLTGRGRDSSHADSLQDAGGGATGTPRRGSQQSQDRDSGAEDPQPQGVRALRKGPGERQ